MIVHLDWISLSDPLSKVCSNTCMMGMMHSKLPVMRLNIVNSFH